MPYPRRVRALVVILAGLAVAPAGCTPDTQSRVYDPPVVAEETFTVGTPQMVLGRRTPFADDPARRGAARATDAAPDRAPAERRSPWWVNRNDGYLNVRERGGLVRREAFVTVQVDRQRSDGDDIRNTFRRRSVTVERGGF